jgi:hypothetical protein
MSLVLLIVLSLLAAPAWAENPPITDGDFRPLLKNAAA